MDALGPAPRAELLHVLMLPDLERADRIGSYFRKRRTRLYGNRTRVGCSRAFSIRTTTKIATES
jgi:hypothetical protein